MKRYLLFSLMVFTCVVVFANPPSWAWMSRTSGSGTCKISNIKSDSQNRIDVVGLFMGEAIFGNITLNAIGTQDAFVAQLDAAGNWLWATAIGGTGSEYAAKIGIDSQDNIYVGGIFDQAFMVGATSLENNGYNDIFCAKLSSSGEVLAAFAVGSTAQDIFGGLAVSSDGDLYLSGTYLQAITIGTTVLTTPFSSLFICKLNNQLNPVWAQQAISLNQFLNVSNLGTDSAGNCYVTGNFDTQCTFGSPNQVYLSSQGSSGFIVKLDASGNGVWAERVGTNNLNIMDSYIDASGNTYITTDIVLIPYMCMAVNVWI